MLELYLNLMGITCDNVDQVYAKIYNYCRRYDYSDINRPFPVSSFNLRVFLNSKAIQINATQSSEFLDKLKLRNLMYLLRNQINFLFEIFRFIFPKIPIKCRANILYNTSSYGLNLKNFMKYDILFRLVKINN